MTGGSSDKKGKRAFFSGLLALPFLLASCSDPDTRILGPSGGISVHLPGMDEKGGERPDRLHRLDGEEFFLHFDPSAGLLRPVPIGDSDPPLDPVPVDELSELADLSYFPPSCCVVSKDSIWVTIPERGIIALLDQKGRLHRDQVLKRPDGRAHVLHVSSKEPFKKIGQRFFVRSSLKRVSSHDSAELFFGIAPGLSFMPEDSSLRISEFGGWPEKYRSSGKDYYARYPHRELIERNGEARALYSYKACETLYFYEGTDLVRKEKAASRYIESFEPFDRDSIGNVAYTKRFLVTSPHYGAIVWDPFRELYYRQAFHRCSYREPDGKTVKGPGDQPWSLIVLNEDLEKLGEMKMDSESYDPGPIFISEKGLLLPKKEDEKEERLFFDVFLPKGSL